MTNTPSSCPTGAGAVAPLTTPFTVPSDCKFPIFGFSAFVTAQEVSCMPPGFNTYYWCELSAGFYSPAVCPSGYYGAIRATNTYLAPLTSGESAVFCCPSSYSPTTGANSRYCYSASTSATAIQIRWRSSDLPAISQYLGQATVVATMPLPSDDSSSSSSSLGTSDPSAAGDQSSAETSESTGVSSGTIAGIVVGVIGGLALLAFGAFILLRKRRRSQHSGGVEPNINPDDGKDAPEVVTEPIGFAQAGKDLDTAKETYLDTAKESYLEPTKTQAVPELSAEAITPGGTHDDSTEKQVAPEPTLEVAPAPSGFPHANYESGLEVVQGSNPSSERTDLEAELASLRNRRQHLMEMQAIEQAEAQIRRRLAELDNT